MSRHRESPVRRVNPSGEVVWVARYTDASGRRLDRLVAHRELQYIRALKTGRRQYMDTRARKLEEARAARARLEDAA